MMLLLAERRIVSRAVTDVASPPRADRGAPIRPDGADSLGPGDPTRRRKGDTLGSETIRFARIGWRGGASGRGPGDGGYQLGGQVGEGPRSPRGVRCPRTFF